MRIKERLGGRRNMGNDKKTEKAEQQLIQS